MKILRSFLVFLIFWSFQHDRRPNPTFHWPDFSPKFPSPFLHAHLIVNQFCLKLAMAYHLHQLFLPPSFLLIHPHSSHQPAAFIIPHIRSPFIFALIGLSLARLANQFVRCPLEQLIGVFHPAGWVALLQIGFGTWQMNAKFILILNGFDSDFP